MLKQLGCRLAQKYLNWAEGYSYDFSKNGEAWLLERLSRADCRTVFDVGANVGEWTRSALRFLPGAQVHCFELSAATFASLREKLEGTGAVLNNVGLSDESGPVEYKDYGKDSGFNTMVMDLVFHDDTIEAAVKVGTTLRGDDYCAERHIGLIDLLKIDVEGAEHRVLEGFSGMLSAQRIRIVQFEYGFAHGDANFLMRDFFRLFQGHGYVVGKLRKGGIVFEEWGYRHNDFRSGPNYIAVRKADPALIRLLAR